MSLVRSGRDCSLSLQTPPVPAQTLGGQTTNCRCWKGFDVQGGREVPAPGKEKAEEQEQGQREPQGPGQAGRALPVPPVLARPRSGQSGLARPPTPGVTGCGTPGPAVPVAGGGVLTPLPAAG